MSEVALRELRNDTSAILRRVAGGERIAITVRGRPAAELVPVERSGRRWLSRAEVVDRLLRGQADASLRSDLEELAGDTTDDLEAL